MHKDDYDRHGSIVENAMVYSSGKFDFFDDRFTKNSRASYPLEFLTNVKPGSTGGHPSTILFLTADAYGVLPPIAKLPPPQAMLWLSWVTLLNWPETETGVTEPKATFSRFFGTSFMAIET